MISIRIGECDIDILPVVNGIVSEAEKVRSAYGGYEAYGLALGVEAIQALKDRSPDDEFDVSELDLVYAERMTNLTGEYVHMPSPPICELVDLVTKDGKHVIALDMNDRDFTELYCDTVPATDFVKEHRLAKKGLKESFDSGTPAEFALEWDRFVNSKIKSYGKVSAKRERFIAEQIRDVAKYRRSFLAVIEIERAEAIAEILRST